ncbi:brain-enriched guanylate kinase-associated protein [Trichomycterus rosablanca]|uniref:brain-enriched guanylate kinase-associated protein n=1 Tax=Trichomycterus rosablanca TaxID=2290929 RepID=UPI002F3573F2
MRRKANRRTLHEQKEDLRKQLSCTTHKLEMLENEFESTRQYLETELRRAQEELEKFTDKLRRIQSSYAALQRINQELEDKIQQATQHHEEEKRAMSREIIVLNNHLMEAKITIEKLREDNELYRKDCKLAAQLLQCGKSHYRAHKLSELPVDRQDKGSPHTENKDLDRRMGPCNFSYPDAGPSLVFTKVSPKPEPGSSCPVTRSPSPQPPDPDYLANKDMSSGDTLQRRVVYKSLDLYSSDTALYCPTEERRRDRWQERRQSADLQGKAANPLQAQNSTDSNPGEDNFYPSFAQNTLLPGFAAGSTRASSSYSSFSAASDDKGHIPSSTLSSSHLALYMDWPEGDYEQKSLSSYGKESPRVPKSHSFQHMTSSPEKDNFPVYSRTASCYSEPYQSMGSSGVPRDSASSIHFSEEELTGRWRRMSVEDVNAFSYRKPGRASPHSFSEQHFATGPCKIKLGPLYSSFQEGEEVFQTPMLDARFLNSSNSSLAPSPNHNAAVGKTKKGPMYPSMSNSQDSRGSFFHAGGSKDNESTVGKVNKEYVDVSPISSAESLHQSPLEASNMQHYQLHSPGPQRKTSEQHQKFGSTGLSRKDSLTKAQLYGTLLN